MTNNDPKIPARAIVLSAAVELIIVMTAIILSDGTNPLVQLLIGFLAVFALIVLPAVVVDVVSDEPDPD